MLFSPADARSKSSPLQSVVPSQVKHHHSHILFRSHSLAWTMETFTFGTTHPVTRTGVGGGGCLKSLWLIRAASRRFAAAAKVQYHHAPNLAFANVSSDFWRAGVLSGGCDGRIKLWSLNSCSECQGCGVVDADNVVPSLQVQCPRCDGRKHVLVSSFNVNLLSLFGGRCAVTSITVVGSDAFVGTSSRCALDVAARNAKLLLLTRSSE